MFLSKRDKADIRRSKKMKRMFLPMLIICLVNAIPLTGCGSKETAAPAVEPQPEQEIAGEHITPTETPAPEVTETEDEQILYFRGIIEFSKSIRRIDN